MDAELWDKDFRGCLKEISDVRNSSARLKSWKWLQIHENSGQKIFRGQFDLGILINGVKSYRSGAYRTVVGDILF